MPAYTFQWSGEIHFARQEPLSFSLIHAERGSIPLSGECNVVLSWKAEEKEGPNRPVSIAMKWSDLSATANLWHAEFVLIARKPRKIATRRLYNPVIMRKEGQVAFNHPFFLGPFKAVLEEVCCFDLIVMVELDQTTVSFNALSQLHAVTPNDLQLSFPQEKVFLYANSGVLREVSPYFANFLDSAFAKTNESTVQEDDKESPQEGIVKDDFWCDSDDEATSQSAHSSMAKFATSGHATPYQIEITEHRAITYAAFLHWVYTKRIRFGSLRSSQAKPPPKSGVPVVSPKSIYRLAHYLEVDALKVQALEVFTASLTVANVAEEMFSPLSGAYEETRKATINFACKHWEEVKRASGMKQALADTKERKSELQALIGAELLEKLSEM